jgi:hypothetical protein
MLTDELNEAFNKLSGEAKSHLNDFATQINSFSIKTILDIGKLCEDEKGVNARRFPLFLMCVISHMINSLGDYSSAPFMLPQHKKSFAIEIENMFRTLRKEIQKAEQNNNKNLF